MKYPSLGLMSLLVLLAFGCSTDRLDIETDIELRLDVEIDGVTLSERQVGISSLDNCDLFCSTFSSILQPNGNRTYFSYSSSSQFYFNQELFQLRLALSSVFPEDDLTTEQVLERIFQVGEFSHSGSLGSSAYSELSRLYIRLNKYLSSGEVENYTLGCGSSGNSIFSIKEVRVLENIPEFQGEDLILVTAEFGLNLCDQLGEHISLHGDLVYYFRTRNN